MKLEDFLVEGLDSIDMRPVRDAIVNVIDDLERVSSILEVHRILTRALDQFNIQPTMRRFSLGEDIPAERKNIGLGAARISEDGIIEIELMPNILEVIQDPKRQRNFINMFLSLARHEIAHVEQTRRAGKWVEPPTIGKHKKMDDWAQYLADPQEIGAHAQEAIQELQDSFFSKQQIIDALKTNDTSVLKKSNAFLKYLQVFRLMTQAGVRSSLSVDPHKILNALKKQMIFILTQ